MSNKLTNILELIQSTPKDIELVLHKNFNGKSDNYELTFIKEYIYDSEEYELTLYLIYDSFKDNIMLSLDVDMVEPKGLINILYQSPKIEFNSVSGIKSVFLNILDDPHVYVKNLNLLEDHFKSRSGKQINF